MKQEFEPNVRPREQVRITLISFSLISTQKETICCFRSFVACYVRSRNKIRVGKLIPQRPCFAGDVGSSETGAFYWLHIGFSIGI